MTLMTCIKNSRRVDAAVARLVFVLGRDNIRNSYLDRLILELLNDELSFASHLLNIAIGDSYSRLLISDLERDIEADPVSERVASELFYSDLCRHLRSTIDASSLSSVHLLYYALSEPRCRTHRLAIRYGFTIDKLSSVLANLELTKRR